MGPIRGMSQAEQMRMQAAERLAGQTNYQLRQEEPEVEVPEEGKLFPAERSTRGHLSRRNRLNSLGSYPDSDPTSTDRTRDPEKELSYEEKILAAERGLGAQIDTFC